MRILPRKPSNPFKRLRPSRTVVIVILLVLVIGGAAAAWWRLRPVPAGPTADNEKRTDGQPKAPPPDNIRIIATGDIIAHDALNLRAKQDDGTYDYLQFMGAMQPFFKASHIRFCNQAVPSGGKLYTITGYPVFNSPLEVVHDMAELGCNVVNTGTNHSFDRGLNVIKTQLEEWDKQQNILAVAGANRDQTELDTIRYFEVMGVKFAFLSYTTYTNKPVSTAYAVSMYNKSFAEKQLKAAQAAADQVIVSMRWGTEYSPSESVYQSSIAQELADMGADIILGHGPHVVEPVQKLRAADGRDAVVWYSLGNFLNAQLPIEALTGCVAVMDFNIPNKQITSIGCLPIYMHYEWTAEEKAKEDLLKRDKFLLVPLDTAAQLISRSQQNTTVDAQIERLRGIVNKHTPVKMIKSDEF